MSFGGVMMKPKVLSSLTLISTALAAITLFWSPYELGLFPGGAFEDTAIGPIPVWTLFAALSILLAVVFIGHLLETTRNHERG